MYGCINIYVWITGHTQVIVKNPLGTSVKTANIFTIAVIKLENKGRKPQKEIRSESKSLVVTLIFIIQSESKSAGVTFIFIIL